VGELVTTHGLFGWLKLHPYNPQTTVFLSVRKIHLQKGSTSSDCLIEGCKGFKKGFLLKIAGMDTIDAVEPWVGSVVSVDESDLQPLEAGEYYHYQILGLEVLDHHDRCLGRVTRVWAKQGGDLYIVTGAGKEYLIPAVSEIIERVDLAQGKIIINPPAGLLDL
jgi:16S rRNA processing protein RimM